MPSRLRCMLNMPGFERGTRALLVVAMSCALTSLGTWAFAQAIAPQRVEPPVTLSGDDLAFRVETRRGDAVAGRLMVRINGRWVEADVEGGPHVRPLQVK